MQAGGIQAASFFSFSSLAYIAERWSQVCGEGAGLWSMPSGSWSWLSDYLLFPGGASGKECTWQCIRHKRCGSVPRLGRSPGEGNGNPLQYSCLENPMDRGTWLATVHRVAKSHTCLKWLNIHTEKLRTHWDWQLHLKFHILKRNLRLEGTFFPP